VSTLKFANKSSFNLASAMTFGYNNIIGSMEMFSLYGSTYSAALAIANTDSTGHW
jgi:hypothetical protein